MKDILFHPLDNLGAQRVTQIDEEIQKRIIGSEILSTLVETPSIPTVFAFFKLPTVVKTSLILAGKANIL